MASSARSDSDISPLERLITHNLQHQHYWSEIVSYSHIKPSNHKSSNTEDSQSPLPLLSGLPPTRIYTHPDEQTAYLRQLSKLKAELASVAPDTAITVENALPGISQQSLEASDSGIGDATFRIQTLTEAYERPRREYVAGIWKNVAKGITLRQIAGVFDCIGAAQQQQQGSDDQGVSASSEVARFLLAIVDSDSSVVFYVVHDGVVKARQN